MLISALLTCHAAFSCELAAGVVPYSKLNDEIFLLIADHRINRTRGWAAFGGCVDKDESISAAALRELHEETRCALDHAIAIDEQTPKVTIGKFTGFALEVPFVPSKEIENNASPPSCDGVVFKERGPWAWVRLSDLLQLFETNHENNAGFTDKFLPNARHRWFWSKSSRVINALNEQEAFR